MAKKTKHEQGLCEARGCKTVTKGHKSLCEKHRAALRDRPKPPNFAEAQAALAKQRAEEKRRTFRQVPPAAPEEDE